MSEGLQNKMYNYELSPPEGTWEKIASALDDAALDHSFPSTLYEMEVEPPSSTWANIKSSLGHEETKSRRTIPLFVRYAAAAAVAGILIVVGLQIFRKQSAESPISKKEVATPAVVRPDSGSVVKEESPAEILLPDDDKSLAKLDVPSRARRKTNYNNRSLLADSEVQTASDVEPGYQGLPIVQEYNSDKASRYVMLMTPDGNIIRMSKKLGGLVCCVSGQEQDEGCKSQLKVWQEKMVNSSVISPGNFMDIMNIVSNLQGIKN